MMKRLSRTCRSVRELLLASLLLLSLVLVAGEVTVEIGSAQDRPNIIYLMADDQRADTLGCMGNDIIQTPNLDSLASVGVVFDNAFTTTAICMTSRACVFTGQYAARHGINSFNVNFTNDQLQATYLGRLHSEGYRTGFIGKWGVGHPSSADSVLDENLGFPGQSQYYEGNVRNREGRHLTARMGDQAIEFLNSCDSSQPFHLSISFKAPHCQDSSDVYSDQFPPDRSLESLYEDLEIPYPPTASHEFHDRMPDFLKDSMNRDRWAVRFRSPTRYQQCVKDYYRLITGIDVVVGRIRSELERLDFDENTIIIYTSDHGFFLGEYGFAGKWTPHEVSIRVPLIIFDPRTANENTGIRRDETALLIDMAPTILDYAGLEPSTGMQGRSLVPITDGSSVSDWRDEFFYEHWFSANGRIIPSEGVRTNRWKYHRYLEFDGLEEGVSRFEELYDIQNDPNETNNLANNPRYAERLEEMRRSWEKWRMDAR